MDRYGGEVHKLAKIERGQYSAILTEKAWPIEDVLYGFQETINKEELEPCISSIRTCIHVFLTKILGAYHSTKNFGVNFRKFPWANGTDFFQCGKRQLFAWNFSMTRSILQI